VEVAVRIRAARRADLGLLLEALGEEHYVYFRDVFHVQEEGLGRILFAFDEEGGTLVGGVLASWAGPHEKEIQEHLLGVPMIAHLHVARPSRGRGYGRQLLMAAEHVLREQGHEWVLIGVNSDNHSARALYLHLGYEPARHPDLRSIDPLDETQRFDVYVARLDRVLPPPSRLDL
jgi:GNAT superfamily N-acetyltransferase